MENWEKPSRDHRKHNHRENPSFSSSLLDVIYRSIDEGEVPMMKQKQSTCFREQQVEEAEKPNSRRARKVENWMMEKRVMGRNSLTEFERRTRSNSNASLSMHSSSTSSESSGFSSSESESFYYGVQRPKPIRTSVSSCTFSSQKTNFDGFRNNPSQTQKPKHDENGFGGKKTKSKALRILYGELKKAKQPTSPGARLASFLNSLFTSSGNAKKTTKVSTDSAKSAQEASTSSTCSSASSFSRSCLSKTPSSRNGGVKRSVRFCPVSVIVDEDCRPCGQKNLHHDEEGFTSMKKSYVGKSSNIEEVRFHVMEESRRVEELAKELLKNYEKKKKGEEFDHMMHDDDGDDDDDAASCASSDLFELDNLSAIGIERYREELPVYETTHFNTNRAIANGFIM